MLLLTTRLILVNIGFFAGFSPHLILDEKNLKDLILAIILTMKEIDTGLNTLLLIPFGIKN